MPQSLVARSAREQIGCPLWEEGTAQPLLRFSVTQHEQQFQKMSLAVSKEGYFSLYLLYTIKPLQEVIDESTSAVRWLRFRTHNIFSTLSTGFNEVTTTPGGVFTVYLYILLLLLELRDCPLGH